MKQFIPIFVFLCILTQSIRGDTPPDFQETRTAFDGQLEEARTRRREQLLALRDHYVQALKALEERYTTANQTAAAEEVRAERLRTEAAHLDAELQGRRDEGLRTLVRQLRSGIVDVENSHSTEVRSLVERYQHGAGVMAQRLHSQGDTDSARQWHEWGQSLSRNLEGLRAPASASTSSSASTAREEPPREPLEGLILYYTFQNVGEDGVIRDQSPSGNHGRLIGGLIEEHGHVINSGALYIHHQGSGRIGRIQRVPEEKQAVQVNAPVRGFPLEDFTIILRFRVDRSDKIRGAILGSEGIPPTTDRPRWRDGWRLTPSGLIWYGDATDPEQFWRMDWDFRASPRWNHFALRREDGELSAVMNGRIIARAPSGTLGPLTIRYNHFYIGDPYFEMYPPRYESFFGGISSVAIFNRALPVIEIQNMMNDPNAP